MSREIMRIGVYWYPPSPLKEVIEQIWQGALDDKHECCALVARQAGDAPIWRAHVTLLDAVTIIADQREAFVHAVQEVTRQYLPITLTAPEIVPSQQNISHGSVSVQRVSVV